MFNLANIELTRLELREAIMKCVQNKFRELRVKMPSTAHTDLYYVADDFADSFGEKIIKSIEVAQRKDKETKKLGKKKVRKQGKSP